MSHTDIGAIHLTSAWLALVTGTVVCFDGKGHAVHRALGITYVAAMIATNVAAFGMYRLTGSFTLFHAFAALSLLTVGVSMGRLFSRRADRIAAHGVWMLRSYIGLLAAAVVESSVRLPAVRHWLGSPDGILWFGAAVAVLFTVVGRMIIVRTMARPVTFAPDQG